MAQAAARRPSLALRAFVRYLELSGETLDPKRASDVRARIDELRAQLATVKARAQPPESVVQIDGSAVEYLQAVLVDPASNDQLGNRIKLQDEVSVGVASGACLIVAAVVWFAGDEQRESAPKVAWSPRSNGAELGFVW